MSTVARITASEYERMVQHGVFEEDPAHPRRLELVHGELREQMTPPDPPHEATIDWLNRWSIDHTRSDSVIVRVQNTVGLHHLDSVPQPDLAWVRSGKNYRQQRPEAGDVLLLIEVSDSSLRYDLGVKSRLYAEGGIADYWVVDVGAQVVHVHRKPSGEYYSEVSVHSVGETIAPLCRPDLSLQLSEVFAQ